MKRRRWASTGLALLALITGLVAGMGAEVISELIL